MKKKTTLFPEMDELIHTLIKKHGSILNYARKTKTNPQRIYQISYGLLRGKYQEIEEIFDDLDTNQEKREEFYKAHAKFHGRMLTLKEEDERKNHDANRKN